jgi:hypothetical protein
MKIFKAKQQLIAIGDSVGVLHIMEVPWALRRTISGELQAVKLYFQRETERREYVKQRWDFREEEKRELERQAALKAGVIILKIIFKHFFLIIIFECFCFF